MLQKLDVNFRTDAAGDGLQWFDAFDESIAIHGLGWLSENRKLKSFRRIPERPELERELSEGVKYLSHCPAGAFLSFFTDSPDISVEVVLQDVNPMDHMPATGQSGVELFARLDQTWHAIATGRPSVTESFFKRALIQNGCLGWCEYRLYLPLYSRVRSVAVGIRSEARIQPSTTEADSHPLFFYGTSITQGGCASTSGSDFVSEIGRMLNTEVINLGFSGNGKGESRVAELISEIDAGMFVLDYAANVTPDELQTTLPDFVDILCHRHPDTPIVLISNVTYNQVLWDSQRREALEQKRDVMMEFYVNRRKSGDESIHFIDGNALLVPGQSGAYVDGVHPTSAGFATMAHKLAPQLALIRRCHQRL